MQSSRALFVMGSIAIAMSGCTSLRSDNWPFANHPVSAIEIRSTRNLGEAHVRITDPKQIEQLSALIREVRSGLIRAQVSLDAANAKVVKLQIIRGKEQTNLTLVSGMMLDPEADGDEFYDITNPAQAKLWNLVLLLLNSSATSGQPS